MSRHEFIAANRLESLLELFSVVMVLDRQLNVAFASDTLLRHMPSLEAHPPLLEAFNLLRPGSVDSYDDIELKLGSLFLLTSADESLAIRGQVINGPGDAGDVLVFCGAPWLFWMTRNCPDIKLGLKDFSPQDVQIDQLFYMATETRMIQDLEQLNMELKEAKQEVDDAQAARSAFFARMSHEMRTPLNGVVSAISLMREQSLQGQSVDLLELASKSSHNLMQVVNYVLDVSKLESADSENQVLDFDLPDLVESVLDIVRARAMEKGIALHSHVATGVASSYCGDAPRLSQVLLNLLVNAVKFTERGSVSVTVEKASSDSQALRMNVGDTGVGVPKDAQAKIFEPFATLVDNVLMASQEGTGLGLDIARRYVEAMGGRIGVASSPGVGSTFWIEIPLEPAAEMPGVQHVETSHDSAGNRHFQGRVLLVDDNETNLMLGSMILEAMGVTVTQVNSGEAAVAKVREEVFDLVFMDISMPGIDGYEATRQIRTSRSTMALPVIALTAYASSVEREKSELSGMNDYLTKPIERDKLAAVLERWLPASAASPLVDMPTLESMLEQIGRDNLIKVIGKFHNEASDRWQALARASSSADLARESHTLASTCSSFGLPIIAGRLQAIEVAAKGGATVDEVTGLPGIGEELLAGLQELQSTVREMTSRSA